MYHLLTLNNNHVFICGITRSGKTYFAKKAAAEIPYPVLFFNVQGEKFSAPFVSINCNSDLKYLIKYLKAGIKLNFEFENLTQDQIMRVIGYILNNLMRCGQFSQQKPVYICIDEAQLLQGSALKAAIDVSTRGLAKGIRLISITQRPALVNKTIYTQAAEQYLFRLAPSEKQYLQNKGIDFDYCMREWERLGDHSFIFSDGFNLTGSKKI